eukprot:COSAG02_NODE_8465_length_2563_cov_2.666802_3_plen_95_part_01
MRASLAAPRILPRAVLRVAVLCVLTPTSDGTTAGDTSDEFHMRHDWNSLLSDQPGLLFRHFSEEYYPPADALVDYLGEYAAQLGLRVRYNTTITQ